MGSEVLRYIYIYRSTYFMITIHTLHEHIGTCFISMISRPKLRLSLFLNWPQIYGYRNFVARARRDLCSRSSGGGGMRWLTRPVSEFGFCLRLFSGQRINIKVTAGGRTTCDLGLVLQSFVSQRGHLLVKYSGVFRNCLVRAVSFERSSCASAGTVQIIFWGVE